MTTKTIREWLSELPEPERTQAIENTPENIGRVKSSSMSEAIECAFPWYESPQGHNYCEEICERYNKDAIQPSGKRYSSVDAMVEECGPEFRKQYDEAAAPRKIYVLTDWDDKYYETAIIGAFSTRELAQAWIDRNAPPEEESHLVPGALEHPGIKEFELDSLPDLERLTPEEYEKRQKELVFKRVKMLEEMKKEIKLPQ